MRLIKMEEDGTERVKEQSPSYTSMKEAEVNALRDHNVGREATVKGAIEAEELIPSPYINVQRVPDVNTTKNFLTNPPLLSGNELLVDINGDLISSGSISLERYIPHQYEDDLLHEDLTEDDKRLAAALVAVQLVNQQKQQSGSHILPMLAPTPIPVGSKLVNVNEQISLMPPMSGPNKITTSETDTTDMAVNSPGIETDKSGALSNCYIEIHQNQAEHRAHLESLGIHTETDQIEISTEEIEIGPNEVIKTELSDFVIQESNIKTEVCDGTEQLALSEEEQESDDLVLVSDYENGDDKSRNSLPHKKRIPRKLKQPRKSGQGQGQSQTVRNLMVNTYKCAKCSELFTSPSAFAAHKVSHAIAKRPPYQSGVVIHQPQQQQQQQPHQPMQQQTSHQQQQQQQQVLTSMTTTAATTSSFSCELCFRNFTNQWKFFEHLKSHYEPIDLETAGVSTATTPTSVATVVGTMRRGTVTGTGASTTTVIGAKGTGLQSDLGQKNTLKSPTMKIRTIHAPAPQSPNSRIGLVKTPKTDTTSNNQIITQNLLNKWAATSHLQDVTITTSAPGSSSPVAAAAAIGTASGASASPSPVTTTPTAAMTTSILHQQLTQQEQPPAQQQQQQVVWECEPCKRVFRRQKTYETHMSVVHPKQEEIEEFSEPEDMMEGIRVEVHSDDDKETMEKDGTIQKEWYREEDLHAAEADLQEMEERTKNVYVNAHMCEMCNKAYETKAHLNQHISQQHADIMTAIMKRVRRQPNGTAKRGNLTCKQCGRNFHHRNSLMYHLKSHLGERPHQCEVCGKGFYATSALKVHMRQHSGVKPFKCEFCGRNFRQWGDLKYHCISIHSDQKNFQCEYCGKDFARKYSLTVHSRIHTGERNYKCEYCDKSFRASSYLQNHRRIHTGEKPHPCDVCGKPFRVRSDMKRHMITHSKEPYTTYVVKKEPGTPSSNNDGESKLIIQLDDQIPEISKVEELEVSTVESILPDETVSASNRLQEELTVTYAQRDPLEPGAKESNTLYVWPVYMT